MRRTALMFALAGLVGALVAVPIAVYASHQFTDVPNTNPFHADIDWLADAGVTKGCSTTAYCPSDNVTREQMAAFMRRLAENQVVDAGQLNGLAVDEFVRTGQVLHGSIDEFQSVATGDITGFQSNGNKLVVDFAGHDLRACSGVVTPGINQGTTNGIGFAYFPIVDLGVGSGISEHQAVVAFYDLNDFSPRYSAFHIVIVCP